MYEVDSSCSTMELLEYLNVAPEGTCIEKIGEDSESFFKLDCGKWTDCKRKTYGSIDLALEIEGNFKPFKLNDYRLFIGNHLASGIWPTICTDPEDCSCAIHDQYVKYLVTEVGVTREDRDMTIHVTIEAASPIKYIAELIDVLDEFKVSYNIEIV